MRNKAIVRIEASEEIRELIATPFVASIFRNKINANEYVVKEINPDLYLQENFIERIESATKAYQLVCKATGLLDETSTAWNALYISKMKAILSLTNKETYQGKLIEYLQFLEYQLNKNGAQNKPNPLLETTAAAWLNKADQYTTLNDKPALVTVTKRAEIIRIQMEIPESPFNDEMLEEILYAHPDNMKVENQELHIRCPDWYVHMPDYEKALFNQVMEPYTIHTLEISQEEKDLKKETLKANIQAISSRLRSIPGVANFSRHECLYYQQRNDGYHLVNSTVSYRSSAISPRDQLDFDTHVDATKQLLLASARQQTNQIIQTFSDNNPDANVEKLPILLQTLLSPIRGLDSALYENKKDAIDVIKDHGVDLFQDEMKRTIKPENLIDTNHPLNAARHINETGRKGTFLSIGSSERTTTSIERLLEMVSEKLLELDNESPEHRELQHLYTELLQRWPSANNPIALDNNREMHLAALEGLIVQKLGGLDHSTCVSGKDRDALLHIYKDAIQEYYIHYNAIPPYDMNDISTFEERQNFVNIFADIFLTKHQQLNAGQNAPGASGIKTPDRYLPEDILTAIKELAKERNEKDPIKESNALANNNDFGKLLKKQPNHVLRHAGLSALAGLCTGIGLSGIGLLVTGGILTLCSIGLEIVFPFAIPIGIAIGCIITLGVILGGGIGYGVQKKSEENKWNSIAGAAPEELIEPEDGLRQGRMLHQALNVNREVGNSLIVLNEDYDEISSKNDRVIDRYQEQYQDYNLNRNDYSNVI